MKRARVVLALCVSLVAAGSADAGTPGTPSLHVKCEGTGRVTVVLFAGYQDPLTVWERVQSGLAQRTRVCAYDRAGEGSSLATRGPQTFAQMAAVLHRTLVARGIHAPLVLVAHSLGGDIAVTYAVRYSAEVRSVVLLDATPPTVFLRTLGIIPAGAQGVAGAVRSQALALVSWNRNQEHLAGARAFRQLSHVRRLAPTIRLRVLAHGIPFLATGIPKYGAALEKLWRAGQRRWASLVPGTKVETVAHSGHYIYRAAPRLVIRLILAEVKHAAR